MCVLFFAHRHHPRYPLVFAGNRDEAYGRPAIPADWWEEGSRILAGRDLDAGGTWLGVSSGGRWSVVTNVRDLPAHRDRERSRGALPTDFLRGSETPEAFAARVFAERDEFNPFNLIVGDAETVWIVSTHTSSPEALAPGIYGLSNATLDAPWPKVRRGKAAFEAFLEADVPDTASLLTLLRDEKRAPDDDLPHTGVGLEMERMLSPIFIAGLRYGTRASSVMLLGGENDQFVERTYLAGGASGQTVTFPLTLDR